MGQAKFKNLLGGGGGCSDIAAAMDMICGCDSASGQVYETGRAEDAGSCVQV